MTAREERLPEKAVKMLFSSRLQRYARGARVHSKLAANSEHLHARLKRDKQRVQKDVTTVSEHNVRLIDALDTLRIAKMNRNKNQIYVARLHEERQMWADKDGIESKAVEELRNKIDQAMENLMQSEDDVAEADNIVAKQQVVSDAAKGTTRKSESYFNQRSQTILHIIGWGLTISALTIYLRFTPKLTIDIHEDYGVSLWDLMVFFDPFA